MYNGSIRHITHPMYWIANKAIAASAPLYKWVAITIPGLYPFEIKKSATFITAFSSSPKESLSPFSISTIASLLRYLSLLLNKKSQ